MADYLRQLPLASAQILLLTQQARECYRAKCNHLHSVLKDRSFFALRLLADSFEPSLLQAAQTDALQAQGHYDLAAQEVQRSQQLTPFGCLLGPLKPVLQYLQDEVLGH